MTLQVEGVSHYKRARGPNLVSEILLSPFPNLQTIVAYCSSRSGWNTTPLEERIRRRSELPACCSWPEREDKAWGSQHNLKEIWLCWIYNILKSSSKSRKTGFPLWHGSLKCGLCFRAQCHGLDLNSPPKLTCWWLDPLRWCWGGIGEGSWLVRARTHQWWRIHNLTALLGASRSFPVGGCWLLGNVLEVDILFPTPPAFLLFPVIMRRVSFSTAYHVTCCFLPRRTRNSGTKWSGPESIGQKSSLLWWITWDILSQL